jgi:hypothetical protein
MYWIMFVLAITTFAIILFGILNPYLNSKGVLGFSGGHRAL